MMSEANIMVGKKPSENRGKAQKEEEKTRKSYVCIFAYYTVFDVI